MKKIPNRGFELIEYEYRLEKIQSIMHKNKIDILLITSEYLMRYFTGFSTQFWQSPTRPWYLIIPMNGLPKAVIPEIGSTAMQRTCVKEIHTWPSPNPQDEGISLVLKLLKEVPSTFKRIGAELGKEMTLRMPIIDFFYLQSNLSMELIDASPILWNLRMIKSNAEINKIKHVCRIVSNTYKNVPILYKKGDSERDIARKLSLDLILRGVDTIPFLPVVSGQGGVSQIIYEPTDRILQNGDILFIDTGSTFDGYFCDCNRNFSIGKASKIVNEVYEILWNSTQSVIEEVKPGLTLSYLWKIMFDQLYKYLPNKSYHGRFGHGFGLQLTEPPSISLNSQTKLVPNMVLTIEPSVEYLPGKIIVHEENIVITEDGAQLLTIRAPYSIPEII